LRSVSAASGRHKKEKAAAGFEIRERKGLPDKDDATPNGAGPKTKAEVVVNG
jgi:hypothetical protein